MKPYRIFISSVQKEFQSTRKELCNYIENDPLFRDFFEVFLFENVPAKDKKAEDLYIVEVDQSDIYLGLFGNEYGKPGTDGFSPTEREFRQATKKGKHRLVYVRGRDDSARNKRMKRLINEAGNQLIRKRFVDVVDLKSEVYRSLISFLEDRGDINRLPFDASICRKATKKDIDTNRLKWFLRKAKNERNYSLSEKTPPGDALINLNLSDKRRITNAAVLLFGSNPQRVFSQSETKCMHFHGTEVEKPIPSYQAFKGSLFAQVDNALDFVLSKLNRSIIPVSGKANAKREYEIPDLVIREAIVNAIVHRDYTSKASIQVMVLSDRIEIWNPGRLPPQLTPEALREAPHASIPHNPLLFEPFFLTRYCEKAGTGTSDMVKGCRAKGLPEPTFTENSGQFVVTIWRDIYTKDFLAALYLNDRQMKAIRFVKEKGKITNTGYQKLVETTKKTATRDLRDLVDKEIMEQVGTTGRGTYYVLRKNAPKAKHETEKGKGDLKGTKETRRRKGDTKGTKGT